MARTTKTGRRTVLVTGASRGIGKAIKEVLARVPGYDILAPSRQEMDLSDMRSVRRYVRARPDVDILVNNAGINILQSLEEIDDATFMEMLNVNLRGPLTAIREVAPHMKARRFGRIINMSSIWGSRSKERRGLYSMTKFGLNGITKTLAHELGGHGVLVNAVCPGYVNTDLVRRNVPPEEQKAIKKAIPLKRFAEPVEIARLVRFLVSEDNTYITGQVLVIDGGLLA
jgi:NAD(P)-dependent dehydrogenase (short-subunit alcohol dehydrogenase family)